MRGMLCLSGLRRAAAASRVDRVHRTTTTATLLVTVAVSALSGCMTVQRPLAPGPVGAPSQGSQPRPVGGNETEVVQAPAREALEMVGPSRRPSKKPASPSRRAAAPPGTPERSTPPGDGRGRAAANGDTGADLCALGRQYGGWRPGSREATICEETYGR